MYYYDQRYPAPSPVTIPADEYYYTPPVSPPIPTPDADDYYPHLQHVNYYDSATYDYQNHVDESYQNNNPECIILLFIDYDVQLSTNPVSEMDNYMYYYPQVTPTSDIYSVTPPATYSDTSSYKSSAQRSPSDGMIDKQTFSKIISPPIEKISAQST